MPRKRTTPLRIADSRLLWRMNSAVHEIYNARPKARLRALIRYLALLNSVTDSVARRMPKRLRKAVEADSHIRAGSRSRARGLRHTRSRAPRSARRAMISVTHAPGSTATERIRLELAPYIGTAAASQILVSALKSRQDVLVSMMSALRPFLGRAAAHRLASRIAACVHGEA